MKKRAMTLLLALAMIVSLAACGGGGGGPAGTYKLTKVNSGGMDLDVAQLSSLTGVDMNVTLQVNADGTWSMDASALGIGTEAVEGTWTANGSNIDFSAEGDTITASVSGNTIVMEESGQSLTFTK